MKGACNFRTLGLTLCFGTRPVTSGLLDDGFFTMLPNCFKVSSISSSDTISTPQFLALAMTLLVPCLHVSAACAARALPRILCLGGCGPGCSALAESALRGDGTAKPFADELE